MSTDIKVSGALVFPEGVPTRAGEVVNSIDEIYDIPAPRVGMIVYDRSTGLNYIVRSLKAKVIDGVQVDDAQVDKYELYDVASETSRAKEAEGANATAIANEKTRAMAAELSISKNTLNIDKTGIQIVDNKLQFVKCNADNSQVEVDIIPAATDTAAGVMAAADKVALDKAVDDIADETARAMAAEEALDEKLERNVLSIDINQTTGEITATTGAESIYEDIAVDAMTGELTMNINY